MSKEMPQGNGGETPKLPLTPRPNIDRQVRRVPFNTEPLSPLNQAEYARRHAESARRRKNQ